MLQKDREARNKLILDDYKAGMRIYDIADKYSFASGNVLRLLKRAGVWIRGRDGNRKRNMLKRVKLRQFTLSGISIKPYIRALYDPKNIITKECLFLTSTSRRSENG